MGRKRTRTPTHYAHPHIIVERYTLTPHLNIHCSLFGLAHKYLKMPVPFYNPSTRISASNCTKCRIGFVSYLARSIRMTAMIILKQLPSKVGNPANLVTTTRSLAPTITNRKTTVKSTPTHEHGAFNKTGRQGVRVRLRLIYPRDKVA